jgi:hypothetical protein
VNPGDRLSSTVCSTQVVVIRTDPAVGDLECGGATMVAGDVPQPDGAVPEAGLDHGSRLGKRYRLPGSPFEVLCVKPGTGTLTVGGVVLDVAAAKSLPASD